MATHVIPKEPLEPQVVETPNETDWTKPKAMAIPKEGYFKVEQGRYGPLFPRTPACHGFTIIAKIKPGTEEEIRQYGKKLENALAGAPHVLAPLQLHYLRWVLFDIGQDKYFMYQGDLRHRLRQVHRGRGCAVYSDWDQYDFRKARRISLRLENQCSGVHQVPTRTSVSEFFGVRRVSVRYSR
jgi:hypothetical protein